MQKIIYLVDVLRKKLFIVEVNFKRYIKQDKVIREDNIDHLLPILAHFAPLSNFFSTSTKWTTLPSTVS